MLVSLDVCGRSLLREVTHMFVAWGSMLVVAHCLQDPVQEHEGQGSPSVHMRECSHQRLLSQVMQGNAAAGDPDSEPASTLGA